MELRYGMNPHQCPATATPIDPQRSPFDVVHGEPSYINVLDAAGAWQLVREASRALGKPAAASFKHVSPAGVAAAGEIDEVMAAAHRLEPGSVDPLTSAYVRARDADPKSSYGDFVAVSEPVGPELADVLSRVVSDGIVAPGFEPGVVATLSRKKKGRYLVIAVDPEFEPPPVETREVFGMRLTQPRDPIVPDPELGHDDLLLGMIVVKYTQSNSVAYLRDGMTLGVGAGQQSRIDCTRLAGEKATAWWKRRRSDEPDGLSFVSDGALPFADNVEEAARHGVRYIAEPGGSIRSDEIAAACERLDIRLVRTGIRLFQH